MTFVGAQGCKFRLIDSCSSCGSRLKKLLCTNLCACSLGSCLAPAIGCAASRLRLMHISLCDIKTTGVRQKCNSLPKETQIHGVPPPSLRLNFGSRTLVLALLAAEKIAVTLKDVSRCLLFFFNPCRANFSLVYVLVDLDPLGNRLGFPARLGDLPLHPDKDGWHSVLGSWNATTNNTETVNEQHSSNNSDTPIPPVNPPENARPDPTLIFCQHHKCSGNRLATLFILYLHQAHNTNHYRYHPLQQRPSHLHPREIYLRRSRLLLARYLQDKTSLQQALPSQASQ